MNAASAEFVPFLDLFFPAATSKKDLNSVSRIHALILLSIQDRRAAALESVLDDEEQFLRAYSNVLDIFGAGREETSPEKNLADFILATLGNHLTLTIDSTGHVSLIHATKVF